MLVSVYKQNLDNRHNESEIENLIAELEEMPKTLSKDSRAMFRDDIIGKLRGIGWTGKRKVFPSTSSITITSTKDRIGLCLQFGNIARYYADVVKLQHLYCTGHIGEAVLIVYHMNAAKELFSGGGNLATFERVTKELDLMAESIAFPITVLGVG